MVLALLLSAQLWAANTKETVEQVTTAVTLTDDVDYIITSSTPFADEGSVNIQNTDHAVLILAGVKPSKATNLLAKYVLINGQKAVNNTNCQLKMYNRGSIILPYAKDLKPLTVYSEQNFEGESCSDFGLENTGGYMNTLTDKKLNNRIRSFRLKRGHMVTFSLREEGRGYSRCFIAADEDLEVASLPAILDRSISSYRVFKWYDAGKPQLAAAAGDYNACGALNVTSTYTWSAGSSMLPDQECVAHQIYSTWPSPSSLGSATYTCHMKTSNEPRNSADDHPETLADILKVWENLMRTGMRLCSPSSWDGSDYWNGTGFLKEFFDSIDARGWRCDIIDMHCYWAESNFANLKNWVNAVHRPIWISEWCWGASWNNNGSFASGVTNTQVRDALRRICTSLNGMDYVERYFYWNSERDPSRIYKNGALTTAGQMYAQLDGGLAYNGKYDYVPKAPKQMDPEDLSVVFDKESGTANISWREYNGEMNEYIHLERRKSESEPWEVVMDSLEWFAEIDPSLPNRIGVSAIEAQQGWEFRVSEKDANGKVRTSRAMMAVSSDMGAGDSVVIDGQTWYLGGNIITNGDFEMGLSGWLNGKGEPLAQPYFQAVPTGGINESTYLQCYGSGAIATDQSVRTPFPLEANTNYYFSASACNLSNILSQLTLSEDGQKTSSIVAMLENTSANWVTKYYTFNSGDYPYGLLAFRTLGCKASFDNIVLCKLFASKEEALADGALYERKRAEAFMALDSSFDTALQQVLATVNDDKGQDISYVRDAVDAAIRSQRLAKPLQQLYLNARHLASYQMPGADELGTLCDEIGSVLDVWSPRWPSLTWVEDSYNALRAAIDEYLPMTTTDGLVKSPSFESTTGWQTKAGTYKDGDQRLNNYWGDYWGFPFWNAWWSIPKEGNENQTMAIRQEVSGLTHGLYALECRATTEHFCISDQHAYITNGTDSLCSPVLTNDFYDLPLVHDTLRWQRLTTMPVYVDDDGSLTIGFEGSKQNANDLAWRQVGNTSSKGDHREGWWGASRFVLRYHPLYRVATTPGSYGVTCLPYAVKPTSGLTFYQIAAITSDYSHLCLKEISEVEAGMPFIYKSDGTTATFFEYGEEAKRALEGPGNLRGFFKTSAKAPLGYYMLNDGKWQKIVGTRPQMPNYTGIIRPMTDKQSEHIPVVSTWAGPTMPIEGITEEEIAATISDVPYTNADAIIYDMQGRRVSGSQLKKGAYIINNQKHIIP